MYLNSGGRGLKIETWNDTRSYQLVDIFSFNESRPGYSSEWTDALPKTFPFDSNYFSSRSRGFFVPPDSGNYMLYIHCDDRCELYLSNSSHPEDKVSFLGHNKMESWLIYLLLTHFAISGKNCLPAILCPQYFFIGITKVWLNGTKGRKIVSLKLLLWKMILN